MCFGGNNSAPQATVTTPAVPVSDITAGHPTVKVIPPGQTDPNATSQPKPAPASQQSGNVGLNSMGM